MSNRLINPHLFCLARHSTDQLLLLAQKGDALAFEALYFQTQSLLGSVLRKRGCNEPEDIVQETFCRVWGRKAVFVLGQASAKSFLISVAVNVAREQRRKAARSRQLLADFAASETFEDQIPHAVLQEDLGQRLRIARSRLSQNQEAAVTLVYDQQMDLPQAAGQLRCSPQAIRRRLQNARHKLIAVLNPRA
jgi:RNA polymerase sigma factor (sigma-70 family)